MEMTDFRMLAEDGNGKQKFFFLGQQSINGYLPLLVQQTCPLCQSIGNKENIKKME
jgi:hypothetical protein